MHSIVRKQQAIIENKADLILEAQKDNVLRIFNSNGDGEYVFFFGGIGIGAVIGLLFAQIIKKTNGLKKKR